MNAGTITIQHNHGVLILKDWALEERRVESGGRVYDSRRVQGTVVEGGQTSRLFHVTSYTAFPKGEPMSWEIWGSKIRQDEAGNSYVDCTFCG